MSEFEENVHPLKPKHRSWNWGDLDWVDLAGNRCWLIALQTPPTSETRPRILVQQLEDILLPPRAGDEWKDEGPRVLTSQETAYLWCYPEDLPEVIAALTRTLELLREADRTDRSKRPRPYWGELGTEER